MSVGFVTLVHDSLDRGAAVAKHWTDSGCPVVVHVDKRVAAPAEARFRDALTGRPNVRFAKRHRCEWGTWSIVRATLDSVQLLLNDFPDVGHVFLASGSCLPLRPVPELRAYLETHADTDFIESVSTPDVRWTIGGFDAERFTYRFPFSWRRRRRLFDAYVRFQRRHGLKRQIPEGVVPHLGSQWWCLTRRTLDAILNDPERPSYDRFFRYVWIPDESYFQTLARKHAKRIESRSLTLSKFDFQGKPHIFYDDHLQLLRRSDCFVARKIWPRADLLYDSFLSNDPRVTKNAEPNPSKIDSVFSRATEKRTTGRTGLRMQSRLPRDGWEAAKTCAPYSVFQGFSDLFEDFEGWLQKAAGSRVHGHLFSPDRAHFASGETVYNGGLCDSAVLRDYDPTGFLVNLVWNTRGERQCFQFGPNDKQDVIPFMAWDRNASISIVAGAWAVPLFHSRRPFEKVRAQAAQLQASEAQMLNILRNPQLLARVRIWSLAEFLEAPMEALQAIVEEVTPRNRGRLTEAPRMVDLNGFGSFLQDLRNAGMNPYLLRDYPTDASPDMRHQASHPRQRAVT